MSEKKLEEFCPSSQQEWREWLVKNHIEKDAVWLVMYKKSTGVPSVSWSESVDEALCFGWIDSVKKTVDEQRFKQYFGKRKAKSMWSKVNKEKVEVLIANNLMTAAGLKTIQVAKENGSWTFLDVVDKMIVPDDLAEEWSKSPGAEAYYLSLSNSRKKILLHWILSAKRPETRNKRIAEIVENAAENRMPKQFK